MDILQGKEKITFSSVKFGDSKIDFNWVSSFKGFDFDGDGVLDINDCEPFDKTRQDFKPNKLMMADLKKLPILFHSGDLTKTGFPKRVYTIDGYFMDKGTGGKLIKAKSIPVNVKRAIRRFLQVVKERPDVLKSIRQRKTWVIFTIQGENYGFVPLHGRFAVVNLKGKKGIPFGYHTKEGLNAVQESAGTIHHELEHVKQFQTSNPSKWMGVSFKKSKIRRAKQEIEAQKKERREMIRRYRYPTQKKYIQGVRSALLSMDELSRR